MTEEQMWEILGLVKGEVYTFIQNRTREDGRNEPEIKRTRWRFIQQFSHHALFEDQNGIRQCFQPWAIMKLLSGEGTGWPTPCQLCEMVK